MPDPKPENYLESTFDARLYEPPSWASSHMAKKTNTNADSDPEPDLSSDDDEPTDDLDEELRKLGLEPDTQTVRFTTEELGKLLTQATTLKESGNKLFTATPKRLEEAREAYLSALDHLPDCTLAPVPPSGIQEVTEEEAEKLESEEEKERMKIENQIRECTKAVWGNLGAVYLALERWKETVEACSNAIKIDESHVKALHRRAVANEKIGSWSALNSALEDYTKLVGLLPNSSPLLPGIRRSVAALPGRITVQQEKEKDEMLGKLKDLGNSLLGKFGLSTDMFKFEQGEGGGYNMKFQQ